MNVRLAGGIGTAKLIIVCFTQVLLRMSSMPSWPTSSKGCPSRSPLLFSVRLLLLS